jgi:hypothetical protein
MNKDGMQLRDELWPLGEQPDFASGLYAGAPAQGKSVTFGVTRGCIAVASPVSSITWLIAP